MVRSCEGFESRAKLDVDRSGRSRHPSSKPVTNNLIGGTSIAAPEFFLYEPTLNRTPSPQIAGLDTFQLTKKGTDKLAKLNPEPFHAYHRLSGAFSVEKPLLVDYDLQHLIWRIMTPANSTSGETLVRTGTWTNTTASCPHATFPELKLQATNFHFFRKSCLYQPFVTVFRTDGMNSVEIAQQSGKEWSRKSDNNVVMRTASFGAGQQSLEVCARRRDYDVAGMDNQVETWKGLHDDVIVPLGLLAVTRRQMKMEKRLPSQCWLV
jgi:hypothetical protein